MSTIEQLLQPVFGGGVRSVNFFNGRVLSGEDLSDEQEAQRRARRLLGRGVGEGVAFGFEVSEAAESSTTQFPVITVEPGIAVNRSGQTLRLGERTQVGLVRREDSQTFEQLGVTFRDCSPLRPQLYVAAESVYLLTVAPAEGREGRAPTTGAGNVPAAFNTRYLVEGVQFRLIEAVNASNLGDLNTLRNRVAYLCYGADSTRGIAVNPFGTSLDSYGLLDSLRGDILTDCEVPLALIYWSNVRGIGFIDMWSVRRRLTKTAHSEAWHSLVGDRRTSESEAMVLQFQDHVADMLRNTAVPLNTVAAGQFFRRLPPVGLLPLARRDGTGRDYNGVNPTTFFGGHAPPASAFIDVAIVRSLLADAGNYEPVDLTKGEVVWLYQVWQNDHDFITNTNVTPYIIFTTAQMPFRGAALFNSARAGQNNMA
ncbi:MAG: hypothetical protein ACJ74T_05470 [Pyrinomonadaceae bacterium]